MILKIFQKMLARGKQKLCAKNLAVFGWQNSSKILLFALNKYFFWLEWNWTQFWTLWVWILFSQNFLKFINLYNKFYGQYYLFIMKINNLNNCGNGYQVPAGLHPDLVMNWRMGLQFWTIDSQSNSIIMYRPWSDVGGCFYSE